jgi:hypothetical protein
MSVQTTAYARAAILFLAPAVMLGGMLYHPHLGNPYDDGFLANLGAAVVADPLRWAVAHLLVAIGSGLIALAFLALRARLREAGENRWSGPALPFIVMGSVLYALVPAMEFGPLAVAATGADVETVAATQGAMFQWFVPILFTGAVLFLVGAAGFAMGVTRAAILSSPLALLVAVSIVVMAASRLVPLSMVQFHVQAVAGAVALWPLAYAMVRAARSRPATASPAGVASSGVPA